MQILCPANAEVFARGEGFKAAGVISGDHETVGICLQQSKADTVKLIAGRVIDCPVQSLSLSDCPKVLKDGSPAAAAVFAEVAVKHPLN